MENSKRDLACPGIVVGRDNKARKIIFDKGRPGDEFWFFQSKFIEGQHDVTWVFFVRNGRPMWVGIGESEKDLGGCFTVDMDSVEKLSCYLWSIQVVIGIISGYKTVIIFDPPELEPCYKDMAPGKRVAILSIGEMAA